MTTFCFGVLTVYYSMGVEFRSDTRRMNSNREKEAEAYMQQINADKRRL
jgi:hypothetical protein